MDKLYFKFDELAELDCKMDELDKLRMSSMSWDKLDGKLDELAELDCKLHALDKLYRKFDEFA